MKTVQIRPFFFAFESDFVNTLKCIPMVVRYKLDSCGIKLKLHEWAKFSVQQKQALAFMGCYTESEVLDYGQFVKKLVLEKFQYQASLLTEVKDSWNTLHQVPDEVQLKAEEWNCQPLNVKQWISLDTLQRFALVKLSRSGHEGKNFPVALAEFNID